MWVLGALGRIGVYMVHVWDGTRMGPLGAEAENKYQTAFCGSAVRCHARMAQARPCRCRGISLISFTPPARPFHAAGGPSACSCCRAGPGDQRGLCPALLPARPSPLTFAITTYGLMLCPGKGNPPELRRTYTPMPKGSRVPHVPLPWERPRCPNHLEIPGPNSCTRALFPAAATRGSRVPEAAVPAQAKPKSPSQERRAAQLGRFRGENELANANHLGQERRTFASRRMKQSHRLHASRHLSHPLAVGLSLDHSPLGRTNITVTAVVLFPEYMH